MGNIRRSDMNEGLFIFKYLAAGCGAHPEAP